MEYQMEDRNKVCFDSEYAPVNYGSIIGIVSEVAAPNFLAVLNYSILRACRDGHYIIVGIVIEAVRLWQGYMESTMSIRPITKIRHLIEVQKHSGTSNEYEAQSVNREPPVTTKSPPNPEVLDRPDG